MALPQRIMQNIYWTFSKGSIPDANTFAIEVATYHQAVSGRAFPFNWDEIVFDHPKIDVQYVIYIENSDDDDDENLDYTEPFVELTANNLQSFTLRELLHKINQGVVGDLQDKDNCYFEGLIYSGQENDSGVPIYFMVTGS